jgi:GPH family glycoside/pentoside/hexuronide:cation symporter
LTEVARLPNRALFGYALSAAPVMYAYMLVLVMYMKYAVDELGASPAAIGTIFFAAKVWDAFSDPIVGNLSDRTRSPGGRRRPWLRAAAPALAIFAVMLWAPPESLSGTGLIAWISVAVVGFYTAYTLFEVPHMALGAELSTQTHERNRIFGVRQFMRIIGMFLAGTLGTYLVGEGVAAASAMAYGLALLTVLLILGGVSFLPPERPEFQGRGGESPFRALRDVLANRHARLLLIVLFVDSIGVGSIGVLAPFVVEYVVGASHLVPVVLGVYMASNLLGVGLWVWLARFFEKKRLLLTAMIASGIGYGLNLFVGEGDWLLVVASSLVAGTASSCIYTIGYTLKSEVIDYDEFTTGERKEGSYFAAWAFVSKLATGIMIGVVGLALSRSGFVANDPDQAQAVQDTMRVLMGGMPLLFFSIGAALFTRFRLTETEHARLRIELDRRNAVTPTASSTAI